MKFKYIRWCVTILIFNFGFATSFIYGQITYKPFYSESSFNNFEPNINLNVGSLGGSADAAIGAASYLIPLELPAGTNGAIPNLSISYSSQANAGYLGYGWSINGLSSITRGLKTVYHDSLAGPVSLSSSDRFLLDGNRLVNTNGIYGANGCEYAKELTDFSRITSIGITGNSPTWFKVETKEGIVIEFGNSIDSKFMTENNNDILVWNINKMIWPDSNYIEFEYEQLGREHRLKEIKYTGNSLAGIIPYNKIKFVYATSLFSKQTYEAGNLINRSHLLDSIVISADNSIAFKSYLFSYAHNNINEFLVELTEIGSDGTKLNPTIFQYGNQSDAELTTGNSGYATTDFTDVFSGDYDGDGISDMVIVNKEYLSGGDVFYKNFTAYRNNPINNGFLYKQNKIISSIGKIANAGSKYNFFNSDITGDGADDLIYAFASEDSYKLEMQNTIVHSFSNSMNTMSEYTIQRPSNEFKFAAFGDKYFINSDFNGDGIIDILLILKNASNIYKVYVYFGGISIGFSEISLVGSAVYQPINNWGTKNINILDFDGDGKSELMITKGNFSEIFSFNDLTSFKSLHASGYPTEFHLIYLGDFNGDRKTDLLTRTDLNNTFAQWSVSYATGFNWHETNFNFTPGSEPVIDDNYTGTILYIADLNGDGKQDIFKGRTFTNSYYQVYYSRGSDFYLNQSPWSESEMAYLASAGDYNGDGRSDMMIKTSANSSVQVLLFNTLGQDLLLRKAKNGYGHKSEWQYKRLTDVTSTYMRTSFTPHPVNTVQSPMYVVFNLLKDGLLPTRYEYRNMRLHKGGRGLLGFEKITKYSPVTNMYEETEYETSAGTHLHIPKVIRYKEGTNILQTKTFTNEITQLNNNNYPKLLYHRVPSSIDVNIMEGRTTTNTHTVDSYGNVLTSLTDINGVASISENFIYAQYGSFIPNKITNQTTVTTRINQPLYSQSQYYEYNTLGQITGMRTFYGEPKSVYTRYFYNTAGNQDSTHISASGLTDRSSASIYDAKGRYIIFARNTLGQESSVSEYDPRWAKPKVSTGIDGLTTTYVYDAYGRQISMTMPQGYDVQTNYGWSFTFPQRYFISTSHPGKPNVLTRYDKSNRPIETRMTGYNGVFIYTNTTYDSRSRVESKTAPFKSGDTPFVTTYMYDNFSRVTQETNPHTNTQYSYNYSGGLLTSTITKIVPSTGNQISNTVTDATGKMISATDPGGTLLYEYFSNGEVKSVTMGSETLVSNTYDTYVRKTSTTDINTGTTTYETDAYGQLIKEINPLGHTTVQTYNDLGQVLNRIGSEGNTLYEYYGNGTGASINKLKKITSFGGDVEEMTYDAFGRSSMQTTTVDGIPFTTTYTYNIYDQVETEAYPGNFGVKYNRESNGYIQSVQDIGQSYTFYQNPALNAYLQPTSYILGSGFTITKMYNQNYPTSFQAGNGFLMSYNWDYASGNLTSRTLHNQTENFQYDVQNRLTNTTHPASAIATTYASNGNILAKTDAGPDYTYDVDRVNAMRGITTPVYPNNINQSAQNISYTPFQQPANITEGDYRLDYNYGHHYQRNRSILSSQGIEQEKIYYMGNHERKIHNGNTYDIYYISAGEDLISIVVKTNGGAPAYYYTYTDYLGSIQEITTNTGLTSVVGSRQNYDAWGRRRNTNFEYTNLVAPPVWLTRGYTGHEMLWTFRLINMNGRVYDPVLGRVLSPDNVVSMPGSTQGYNRYSYGHNNPLRYTDPDGNIPIIAAVAIGAAVGVLTNGVNNAIHHRNFFDGAGKSAAFGAIGGLVSAGIGSLAQLAPSALDAALIQMNLHGLSAGMISFAEGGNPLSGFVSGATSSVIGSFTVHLGGGATATLIGGGLSGGVGAAITGGSFWQGLQQGLITTGLNHLTHEMSFGSDGGDPVIKKSPILSQPIDLQYKDFEGLGLAMFGLINEGSKDIIFNGESWYDFKQGKSYSHNFHGNQHSGLRSSSKGLSSTLNFLGKGLGLFNQYGLLNNYNQLGLKNFLVETGINGYSTFGSVYGAAVGVGWEIGRSITKTNWYQNWKQQTWLPYRYQKFGY